MATQKKLSVYFGFPSYGGNGGIASEHPDVREWCLETFPRIKEDPRIENVYHKTINDTPITMVRNRFVKLAKEAGADILVMVDSDQSPNLHKDDPWFKPFWDTSFNFLYSHYERGPVAICAPYCGPPPFENVYVFQWGAKKHDIGDEMQVSLDQYTREEASQMAGIQPIAAAPTGLIMYDMRCFDLIQHPYFKYEWTDETASQKASTEDVQNTRDISMCGQEILGYNPLFCNWDSWIGHWKPWNVGKPMKISVDSVNEAFKAAVLRNRRSDEVIVDLEGKSPLHKRLQPVFGGKNGEQ